MIQTTESKGLQKLCDLLVTDAGFSKLDLLFFPNASDINSGIIQGMKPKYQRKDVEQLFLSHYIDEGYSIENGRGGSGYRLRKPNEDYVLGFSETGNSFFAVVAKVIKDHKKK